MTQLRRLLSAAAFLFSVSCSLAAQNSPPRIIYRSHAYRRVSAGPDQWWEMDFTTRLNARLSDEDVAQKRASCLGAKPPMSRFQRDGRELAGIQLPTDRDHWNYPTSLAWSPDGSLILVGSEAGSSTSHFEDYWLLDRADQKWQYAGGGSGAQWSPDGSQIVWTTARDLAPLGKTHVWVSHLIVLDVASLTQQSLTSGMSNESEFFWCAAVR